jgi:Mn-dependent DtxR family transcriptional regulator
VKSETGGGAMKLQESGEMYLESIYVLSKQKSEVHSIDISEYLGYSKPSVSRAVGLLKNGGYIQIDEDNHITLTDSGLEIAEKIYERHTILTDMLVYLGVPEHIAAEDACRMEHDISDESLNAIRKHMGR